MGFRRNDFDVTDRVNLADAGAVAEAVVDIYDALHGGRRAHLIVNAFDLTDRIFSGRHPGYRACDTWYHDLQHTLDVTLTMARLLDGFERSAPANLRLGEEMFILGVIVALFHDIGYIRRLKDMRHRYGAEYTKIHVSRGAQFIRRYLLHTPLAKHALAGAKIVHFTGFEKPVEDIDLPAGPYRVLGNMIGSADIMAQMADRCYLEKCRDRLYPEFALAGIARLRSQPKNGAVFASSADLVLKTPGFYASAQKRLDETLGGAYRNAEQHFGGQNLYWEEVEKNINFAAQLARDNDIGMLKRQPDDTPVTLAVPVPPDAS